MRLAAWTGAERRPQTLTGAPAIIVYVHSDAGMRVLDGTSRLVHSLNMAEPKIDLSEPENVSQYLRFFCEAVQGDEGPFHLVDSIDEIPFSASVNALSRDLMRQKVRPIAAPQLSEGGDDWIVHANVLYSNAVFHAKFRLFRSGLVNMMDDDPVAPDLELGPHTVFRGHVRTSVARGGKSGQSN